MSKHIHQAAAAIGTAAIGTIVLAGPALANRPDTEGGGSGTAGTTAQAARIRAELQDLREQGSAVTSPRPRTAGSPVDLPYLPVGLGLGSIAVVAAAATGLQRRRHHGAQPA